MERRLLPKSSAVCLQADFEASQLKSTDQLRRTSVTCELSADSKFFSLFPGGVGMMCSLSEQGKQLAVQVSNILGMDVCGIDLLMKDDGSFYVCEANANVGFIAFDKACNLDVAGIIADYAASLLAPGRLTRRMSLLSVVSTASETSEPELGPPAGATVDNMSASSSSVDSDPETTERELLTKLPGALFNMNQLLANEIKLLVE